MRKCGKRTGEEQKREGQPNQTTATTSATASSAFYYSPDTRLSIIVFRRDTYSCRVRALL